MGGSIAGVSLRHVIIAIYPLGRKVAAICRKGVLGAHGFQMIWQHACRVCLLEMEVELSASNFLLKNMESPFLCGN